MNKQFNNPRTLIPPFVLILLVVLVAACDNTVRSTEAEGVVVNEYRTWDEFIASLDSDNFGKYKVANSNSIENDDGSFFLRAEQRYYVESETTRFVVAQQNFASEFSANEIKDMNVSLDDDGEIIVSQSISSGISTEALSGLLFASEAYPSNSTVSVAKNGMCAKVEITFNDPSLYPVSLDTCKGRLKAERESS